MPFSTAKLTIVVAVITVLLGTILFLDQFNIIPLSQLPGLSKIVPTPTSTPIPRPKIIYPPQYDPTGRNIFYESATIPTGDNWDALYSGIGVYSGGSTTTLYERSDSLSQAAAEKVIDGSKLTKYIVASFERWEDIPGSLDKYMILKNPQTGDNIAKVRIRYAMAPSGLPTVLWVEDLSTITPDSKSPQNTIPTFKIGDTSFLTRNQVETLIKPGDSIAIRVFWDFDKQEDSLDENGNRVALNIFIRRIDTNTIFNDIGIRILKK